MMEADNLKSLYTTEKMMISTLLLRSQKISGHVYVQMVNMFKAPFKASPRSYEPEQNMLSILLLFITSIM